MIRAIIASSVLFFLSLGTSAQDIKLLLEHLYFENEIEQTLSNNNWVGLFQEDSTFSLKECDIQISLAQHPMVDNDGEQTGLKVTSEPNGSIILISGIEAINQLNFIELATQDYYPDKSEQFDFKGQEYKIAAAGTVKKGNYGDIISDYKLTLNSMGTSQILAESDFFDDAMFNVIWSGDLDGDEQLDLLIDLSPKYSYGLFSLFLSTTAKPGELLKLVSQHKVFYD